MTADPKAIWRSFCIAQRIAADGVGLFHVEADGLVGVQTAGRDRRRPILRRSADMEAAVLRETGKLQADWEANTHRYDGLIYLMYWPDVGQQVLPLYIGKAETAGKTPGRLSANFANLQRDRGKFARWGDAYAYHIGDLSACVLPGHAATKETAKYRDWAQRLFAEVPAERPRLKRDVRFWVKAWPRDAAGIWPEFGPTRLTFLEYLMIGVASAAFPDTLLNR